VLAERLAAVAVEAGGGFQARLALAEARHARGHSREAEALLAELEAVATTPTDRARVALVRANNLLRGLGQSAAAAMVIARAEPLIDDPRWRDELAVLRAAIDVFHGHPRQAGAAVADLLERESSGGRVVLRALAVATSAAAFRGQLSQARAASDRALGLLRQSGSELSLTGDWVLVMLSVALRLAGELDEAEDLATTRYQTTVARRADDFRASWALAKGMIALTRGTADTALRWLREAAVLLREHGAVFGTHGLAWCLGALAQAAALTGRPATATQALNELKAVAPERSYVPDRELGGAWLAAARADHAGARRLALEAAADAARREAEAFEAVALHDAVRLGETQGAERLTELAGQLEGRLAPIYAAHAAALVNQDAAALDRVCVAFFDVGAVLLAAEAAAEASYWHRQAGHTASALLSAGKAHRLAERCQGARTPALQLAGEAPRLTERERHVATLAAQGLSSRAIAEQLVVSIRTVDNHLHNVYAKLGVTSRSQLRGVL
ncbi:MAG: helix-turn-helix transcriptional regulator, partial [Actinomycetota bacterium]|nr:helix-turn-helix transcriptional regulator [Actinomycetota bacterium]